jgi:hypothetical protein
MWSWLLGLCYHRGWQSTSSVPIDMLNMYVKKQVLITRRKHMSSPPVFYGVRVAHLFSFLCCHIMCLYILSSVLWYPLRFPHINDVRFVIISGCLYECACLICVVCVCWRMMVSVTYCAVFLFYFSSSCVPYVTSFSGLSIVDCPFGIL